MTGLMQGLRFRPRLWGFVLALAACAVTVSLGQWQTGRAAEKRDLAARFGQAERAAPVPVPAVAATSEALAFKRLSAKGEFVPGFTLLLDNKVYRGRPGYFVVTPLRLAGSELHVLVNRGWIAAGARREDIPQIVTPPGEIVVDGIGQAHAPRAFSPGGGHPPGRVWQNVGLEEFAQWSGLRLQPVFLKQHSRSADGLVRDWPKADFGIEKHTSYAIQWYLFALVAAVLFLVLSFERDRPAAS